jgi:hypothetical protein
MTAIARFALGVMRFIFPPASNAEEAPNKNEPLDAKIERWRRQAAEYERLGFRELARDERESIRAHERELAAQAWRHAA